MPRPKREVPINISIKDMTNDPSSHLSSDAKHELDVVNGIKCIDDRQSVRGSPDAVPSIETGVVSIKDHPTQFPPNPNPAIKKEHFQNDSQNNSTKNISTSPIIKKVKNKKYNKKNNLQENNPEKNITSEKTLDENNSKKINSENISQENSSEKIVVEKNPGKKIKEEKVLNVPINLSKRQGAALKSEKKFLLYGGAKGGGKSWFLCVWMFLMAMQHRGNKLFFCRRRSVDFTNTTLETWKKVVPANLYRINEQKKKIYIDISGSVIDYGGLDDPLLIQSLNSAEFAHIGIDQAEEIEMDSFSMLRGTLRHRLTDGTCPKYQIRLTANPAQCWLKDYFISFPEEDTEFIAALPVDNPHLPDDYVKNLEQAFKHRPQLLAAYLHGSWDDLSGHDVCIQGKWIDEAKVREPYGKVVKRIVVNDPARFGDDENVIYVMEQAGNVQFIVDTTILEHKSTMDTAGRLSAIRKKWDAQLIAVDSIGIGAGIVDALYELKEPVFSINSSSKPTVETEQVKYYNLRTQMWMQAGEKFSQGKVALNKDQFLAGQLGMVKFKFTSNGKVQVEGKDEIKKRTSGKSPDRADTLIMGLHALDYVETIDYEKELAQGFDNQGRGEKVNNHELETVGSMDDFSGYNL